MPHQGPDGGRAPYAEPMRLIAAMAVAGGCLAAPLIGAGSAAATPTTCDGAGCVPYVNHDARLGGSCNQATRYNFGVDGGGNTLACSSHGQWVSSPPLVGVRLLRSGCTETAAVAQSPDGVPLKCVGGTWNADYSVMFYG